MSQNQRDEQEIYYDMGQVLHNAAPREASYIQSTMTISVDDLESEESQTNPLIYFEHQYALEHGQWLAFEASQVINRYLGRLILELREVMLANTLSKGSYDNHEKSTDNPHKTEHWNTCQVFVDLVLGEIAFNFSV